MNPSPSDSKTTQKKTSEEKVFSGNGSRDLWKEINNADDLQTLRAALYTLACHCQELESKLDRLTK